MAPRSGPRPPQPRPVQVSKKLSWLLRHGAEEEGLTFDAAGYLSVAAVLANRKFRSIKVTFTEIKEIVAADEKGRYTLLPAEGGAGESSDEPADWLVRANQGHSLKIEDAGGLLTPITRENLPAMAVHGTTRRVWGEIVASGGLKPMGRMHVHFATGLPAAWSAPAIDPAAETGKAQPAVVSGLRNSSTILIYLDVSKALDAGLKFGLSENGVVLTEGNAEGVVPVEVFRRVEERGGEERVLVEDGEVLVVAPESWAGEKGKG